MSVRWQSIVAKQSVEGHRLSVLCVANDTRGCSSVANLYSDTDYRRTRTQDTAKQSYLNYNEGPCSYGLQRTYRDVQGALQAWQLHQVPVYLSYYTMFVADLTTCVAEPNA